MTLSCSSTDFENDSDFRPSRARCCLQIQVMPLNSLRISLADYVQLSLQAGFIQRPAIRHPYHHVKGDKAHKTPQRRHSAFTEYVRNNRLPEPVIRVKQPALARFSTDIAHCSSISR